MVKGARAQIKVPLKGLRIEEDLREDRVHARLTRALHTVDELYHIRHKLSQLGSNVMKIRTALASLALNLKGQLALSL